MPSTVLLVGTRKGCFVLESDEGRSDWKIRGPYCEGWPIYHAVHDPSSGAFYAAAASEWHGAGVWRSDDLGETWELSSEGLGVRRRRHRSSRRSRDSPRHMGACSRAPSRRASSRAATAARRGRCSARSTASPAAPVWNDPANQPPGHLGLPAILPHPDDPSRLLVVVQGIGIFETVDDGASWTPRNSGLRADWPREEPEVGFCVHKLVMSPVDHDRLYQQNHCGMHRSDDGGRSWVEITEGLPSDFGFAAAAHPHDRESFYVIPLDPGHGRCMPDGHAAVWRTRDAGSSWRRLDRGLPQRDAHSASCVRGSRSTPTTCRACTSARARARCSRAPTRARAGARSRATSPGSRRSRSRWSRRDPMADVHLPTTLLPLFRGLPRRLDVDAASVTRRSSSSSSAGPACATGCACRARSRRRSYGRTSTSTSTASAPD